MIKRILGLLAMLLALGDAQAAIVTNAWRPIFKGIEHTSATNYPDSAIPRLQVVRCLRVDLADPDIQFFATPPAPNPVPDSRETLSLTITNFLRDFHVQVAVNANFYNPGDPPGEGYPVDVYGLHISQGLVVSAQDDSGRTCSLLFTTNNQPGIVWSNAPPGTNTTGIYTALTGFYPIVSNGVNIAAAAVTNYPDSQDGGDVHLPRQPRTAYGLSQDQRYLFIMTIDGGPQPGYSDGALDVETGLWMLLFGAWDAINMDGGHSTALYMADAFGGPIALNHSNALQDYGHERYIGSHLGIFAVPILGGISVVPDFYTAAITWTTLTNAVTRLDYGATTNDEIGTILDTNAAPAHTATLTGLQPDSTYYYRLTTTLGTNQYLATSNFTTKLFLNDVTASAGRFSATITWSSLSNSTTQVEYGTSTNYGYQTPLDPRMTTNHTVSLSGLLGGTVYYFRVESGSGSVNYTADSTFATTNSELLIFDITNTWRYSCSNLDGVNWLATGYDDAHWDGPGQGLLWVDTRGYGAVTGVQPKNTAMPYNTNAGFPYVTYYFRTHFNFTNTVAGVSLVLSNYVDDGALFYLNGTEIYNLRMGPPPIQNNTTASGYPCASLSQSDPCHGNACSNCPDVFEVSGDLLTNLLPGDNVLAVEVHNYNVRSYDITFGSALYYEQILPPPTPPSITVQPASQTTDLGSNAVFFVLAGGDAPLCFQWRLGGSVIPQATNNIIALDNIQATNLGNYDVVVTNLSGSVTSLVARLAISNIAPNITWTLSQGSNLVISLPSVPGSRYVLESTSDLADPVWLPVSTNSATGSMLNITSPIDSRRTGFFRVRVE